MSPKPDSSDVIIPFIGIIAIDPFSFIFLQYTHFNLRKLSGNKKVQAIKKVRIWLSEGLDFNTLHVYSFCMPEEKKNDKTTVCKHQE